jgi:hypothetical protein
MIDIGLLHPPANISKINKVSPRDTAVAGTEINQDAQSVKQVLPKNKRRQHEIKALVDCLCHRENRNVPSIDIEV